MGDIVQAEQVSEETVSTEEKTEETQEVKPTEQPFTETQEARLQQLVAEASAKAEEKGRREMQGIKDKEVAAAERRVRQAEESYKSSFDNLDEDTKREVELANLRREKQEKEQYGQTEQYNTRLKQSLRDEVTSLGIDPNDTRLDYADDADNYFDGRKRFSESTAKILKTDRVSSENKLREELKAETAKMRRELGLDSTDTGSSPGGGASDEAFRQMMMDADHVTTKEDLKRIEKIRNKEK